MTIETSDHSQPRVAAIILAAGLSSRYRAADPAAISKVLAKIEGEPMVRRIARTALAAGCDPVIVVTGHAQQDVEDILRGLDVRFAHNERYASGLASSLQCGLREVPSSAAGAFIMLADMPHVDEATLELLMERFAQQPGQDALVPVHNGQRGNPVLLARSLFDDVQGLKGDEGARKLLLRSGLDTGLVECSAGVLIDYDTPAPEGR
ncbi:MAG: nucleotidyltransferase family protein [Alphaproteobacteria bacterium]|nr:nucleotidyltransferase family protein [Alphaproteobacteria bacterium]